MVTVLPTATTLAADLEIPWSIAFYPNGNFIVTERPGTFRVYTATAAPRSYAFADVRHVGEGGLLGVALHPTLKWIYFYYTHQDVDAKYWNRVIRTDADFTTASIVLDHLPAGPRHNGGRIKFGPDGYLYIGVGDTHDSKLAQDPLALAGKILRVTDEGKSAPGNPFGNEVYALGIRNCQGITWSTKTGQMFATSHGDIARDNVFAVPGPGANFGWPLYQGDTTGADGVTPALLNSGPSETWAPSGLAYYGGSLFFCGLKGSSLYQIVLNETESKVIDFRRLFTGTFGRLRDVVAFGPHLYLTTSNRDGRGTVRDGDDRVIQVKAEVSV